jgi:hypothetical protein
VETASCVELDYSVGLQMYALSVIAREKTKSLVQTVGMARKGKREVGEVVSMDLRLLDCQ